MQPHFLFHPLFIQTLKKELCDSDLSFSPLTFIANLMCVNQCMYFGNLNWKLNKLFCSFRFFTICFKDIYVANVSYPLPHCRLVFIDSELQTLQSDLKSKDVIICNFSFPNDTTYILE